MSDERFIYMSFCDLDLPEGSRFIGALITYSCCPAHAHDRLVSLGIWPKVENLDVEFIPMEEEIKILPPELEKYLDKFVPASEMKGSIALLSFGEIEIPEKRTIN